MNEKELRTLMNIAKWTKGNLPKKGEPKRTTVFIYRHRLNGEEMKTTSVWAHMDWVMVGSYPI